MNLIQAELTPIERPERPVDLLSAIVTAAGDPQVDAAKIKALWELKKEIDQHNAEMAFSRAMQLVQEEIRPVLKDAKGPTGNRWARLSAIDKSIRPIYVKHGFSLTFGANANADKGYFVIKCQCWHRDGASKTYELPSALDSGNKAKSEIQAVGSTITYLRRYLTALIFNVVTVDEMDDDDGAATHELITQDQADTISTMLDDLGRKTPQSRAKFYALAGPEVQRCEDIPAHRYDTLVAQLQAALRKSNG